jgi:hypothetical protein
MLICVLAKVIIIKSLFICLLSQNFITVNNLLIKIFWLIIFLNIRMEVLKTFFFLTSLKLITTTIILKFKRVLRVLFFQEMKVVDDSFFLWRKNAYRPDFSNNFHEKRNSVQRHLFRFKLNKGFNQGLSLKNRHLCYFPLLW